jgi:hypothetical protein
MSAPHELDTVLRTLDPAGAARPDLSARAQADLERITDTGAAAVNGPPTVRRRGPRHAARLLPIAAAAVGAAVLSLSLLESPPSAYASWTALPTGEPLTTDSPGARTCTQWWSQDAATANLEPVLAEERGDYTLVVGDGPGGLESACLARSDLTGAVSTVFDRSASAPGSGAIRVTMYDTSSYSDPSSGPDTIEEAHSIVTGRIGEDVLGIVVITPQQGPVRASIHQGRFAAWWPWDKAGTASPYPDISFDLELADGTRVEGVPLNEVDTVGG